VNGTIDARQDSHQAHLQLEPAHNLRQWQIQALLRLVELCSANRIVGHVRQSQDFAGDRGPRASTDTLQRLVVYLNSWVWFPISVALYGYPDAQAGRCADFTETLPWPRRDCAGNLRAYQLHALAEVRRAIMLQQFGPRFTAGGEVEAILGRMNHMRERIELIDAIALGDRELAVEL